MQKHCVSAEFHRSNQIGFPQDCHHTSSVTDSPPSSQSHTCHKTANEQIGEQGKHASIHGWIIRMRVTRSIRARLHRSPETHHCGLAPARRSLKSAQRPHSRKFSASLPHGDSALLPSAHPPCMAPRIEIPGRHLTDTQSHRLKQNK